MARDRGLRLRDPVLEALERWEVPSKDDLIKELGKECLPAFYYVFDMMGYKKRKDCDNLEAAHCYDVSSRAGYLMSRRHAPHDHMVAAKILGLLHDVIEERASGLEDVVTCFHELKKIFGKSAADDTMLLTNPYPILINELFGTDLRRIDTSRQMDPDRVMHNVSKRYHEVAAKLEKYGDLGRTPITLHDLDLAYNLPSVELHLNIERSINREHLKEINLSLYEVYIRRIISACESRRQSGDPSFYVPIIVKAADSIDALRTMPISKAYEADSITRKAVIKIDEMQMYANSLDGNDPLNRIISDSAYELKSQLIAMTLSRVMSHLFLVDTRYAIAKRFYSGALNRFVKKYDPDRKILNSSYEELMKPRLSGNNPMFPGSFWDDALRYTSDQALLPEGTVQARSSAKKNH